jgi:hypothetical protein
MVTMVKTILTSRFRSVERNDMLQHLFVEPPLFLARAVYESFFS